MYFKQRTVPIFFTLFI